MNRLLLIGITTVLATLPPMASAQTPPPVQNPVPAPAPAPTPAVEQGSPDGRPTPAATKPDPQQFLASAKQLIDAVSDKSLNDDGRKKLSRLRDDFKNLLANYQTASQAANSNSPANWKAKFDDVERDLTSILGGGSMLSVRSTTAVGTAGVTTTTGQATGAASSTTQADAAVAPSSQPAGTASSGTPAASGSSSTQSAGSSQTATADAALSSTGPQATALGAVAVEEIGVKNLDPGIRAQLEQVRRNVELFFDSATRTTNTP